MQDEIDLALLIARAEGVSIDFKQELKLDTSRERAELVKDICSLANSCEDEGHLLIGLTDDGVVIGTQQINEQQVLQLVSTYISPVPKIGFLTHQLEISPPRKVVCISIKPLARPHKIIRELEHIRGNDVFVRHGSHVFKASPEEIVELDRLNSSRRMNLTNLENARKAFKTGDFETALKIIEITILQNPSTESYMLKANIYEQLLASLEINTYEQIAIAEKYAINGLNSYKFAFEHARKKKDIVETLSGQLRLELAAHHSILDTSTQEKAVDYLKQHAEGQNLGLAKFFDVMAMINDGNTDSACALIHAIEELGFREPILHLFKANMHFQKGNYGHAVESAETGLKLNPRYDERIALFEYKAYCLIKMEKYEDALRTANNAFRKNSNRRSRWGSLYECKYNYQFINDAGLAYAISVDFLFAKNTKVIQSLAIQNADNLSWWSSILGSQFRPRSPLLNLIINQARNYLD